MDINKLEYFLCACRHLNFSKAAEELFVTAQGLNVAINRMEKELNTKLFMRTSKGLVLTESGRHLKESANAIIGEFHRYRYKVHNKDAIHVVCMTHVFTKLPLPVQRLLFNLDSAFSVSLEEGFSPHCEEKLPRGDADFSISVPLECNGDFEARKLFSARIIALVHKDSPLAAEPSLTIYNLRDIPYITTGSLSKTQQILMSKLQQAGIPQKPAFLYRNPASIIEIVNHHPELAGILMDYFLEGMSAPNVIPKQFRESNMGFDICLVKNVARIQSKQARLFEQYLFSLMREAQN